MSGLHIRNIYIADFRSIQRMDISTQMLSTFVGNNDCGKSNILRALNLFFNGETNRREELNFPKDYNFHSDPNQRAKEIVVRLEFVLPRNYVDTNGDLIVWEKRWRSEGIHSDEYWGVRLSTSTRGNEKRERVEIPSRSNVHSLLSKIQFEYIPAVRDSDYFDDLRARIYQTIAEVTARSFEASSQSFQDSINEHLEDLIESIEDHLEIDTSFYLPTDLSPLFQKLDFRSGDAGVSLESRGDGIKVRHIPLMLDFIANQKSSMQVQGSMPYTFIWGYEEPENNLEIKAALALAQEFRDFSQESGYQVLFSTHSPVFYNMASELAAKEEPSAVFFATKPNEEEGTVIVENRADLDSEMGTMLLFAPHVAKFEKQIVELKNAVENAEELAENRQPKLLLEGESDSLFFRKIVATFCAGAEDEIQFLTKPIGAGTNYVLDMAASFASIKKHDPQRPRVAGLLDRDDAGRIARTKWEELQVSPSLARLFRLPMPPHLYDAAGGGYRVPITLESLYDPTAWMYAEGRGWLEDRDLSHPDVTIPNLTNIITSGTTLQEEIDAPWSIYFTKKVSFHRKIQFARYWSNRPLGIIQDRFGFMEEWIEEVVEFLTTVDT